MVTTGSSYCSHSELPVTFGLGGATPTTLEIDWPSGQVDKIATPGVDRAITIQEGKGLVASTPIHRQMS